MNAYSYFSYCSEAEGSSRGYGYECGYEGTFGGWRMR